MQYTPAMRTRRSPVRSPLSSTAAGFWTPERTEVASLGAVGTLGSIVVILGVLGMKMHDRLLAAFPKGSKERADANTTATKEYYWSFLALILFSILAILGFFIALQKMKNLTLDDRLTASVILDALLVIVALILGALGVQIYKNLTDKYTEEQKNGISKSTKDIYNTFYGLMATGALILIFIGTGIAVQARIQIY